MNANNDDNGFGCLVMVLSILRFLAYPAGLYWAWDKYTPDTFWQFIWVLFVGGIAGWFFDLIISGIILGIVYLSENKK